jgi:drug/metabolite transporter (DMT)-like permease
MTASPLFLALAPWVFVFLWSTGWISAGLAAPHADALTFLCWRFALAGLALAAIALVLRAPWPRGPRALGHSLVAGALIHGLYLGAVWWAIGQGLPAGVSGVIAAVQPILTAALAPLLIAERLTARQWGGIALGFTGIVLVLVPKLSAVAGADLARLWGIIAINVGGMVGVTLGTFYQKRFVPTGDLVTGTAVQYVGALAIVVPLALLLEPMRFDVTWVSSLTMLWSVVALSIGGVGLYLIMIRSGAVTRVATLTYLVPPTTALEAWVIFGETLTPIQLAGIAVTCVGVALTLKRA